MFYETIVEYCKKNNLSISAFEKKCGIANGIISSYKDNGSKPNLTTIEKISNATGMSVAKLISHKKKTE